MAEVKLVYGSPVEITIGLASLGNGNARQSSEIINSSNFIDALIVAKIRTSTGTVAYGVVNLFGFGSVDEGTTRTENAGASDAAITLASPTNLRMIDSITANAASTTFIRGPVSVARAFGGILPPRWGIVMQNRSGNALDATAGNHSVYYIPVHLSVT